MSSILFFPLKVSTRKGLSDFFSTTFLEKLKNWEYWPFNLVYFPVFIYWLFLSLKARSLFFFSASNPGIETGGMLGESKKAVLDLIPEQYKAKTLLAGAFESFEEIVNQAETCFDYPMIVKPDIGERGFGVEKINNRQQLFRYWKRTRYPFLVQEYVAYPVELGLFYYRFPGKAKGAISSLTIKEFLSVTGDGKSSLFHLIENYPRAAFQLERLHRNGNMDLNRIPPKNAKVLLEPIGNHSRGTKFLNGNRFINSELESFFDDLSKTIPGFYFGRFDLRCESIEKLCLGESFKIVELNGAGSEPGHIYQPGSSIWNAYPVLFHHWKILYRISRENKKRGAAYMTFREAYNKLLYIKNYKSTYWLGENEMRSIEQKFQPGPVELVQNL